MSTAPTQAGAFTYSGSTGLLHNGERRYTQTQLQERLSKPATLNVKFLKAQLAHYAITPLTGTKPELEARVRNAVAEGRMRFQPKGMRDMEKGLKESWESSAENEGAGGSSNCDASAGVSAYLNFGNNAGARKVKQEEALPPPYSSFSAGLVQSPVKRAPSPDRKTWITGGQPMTEKQASYLSSLCQRRNIYFNPSLTKAEASRQITELTRVAQQQSPVQYDEDVDGMDTSWD